MNISRNSQVMWCTWNFTFFRFQQVSYVLAIAKQDFLLLCYTLYIVALLPASELTLLYRIPTICTFLNWRVPSSSHHLCPCKFTLHYMRSILLSTKTLKRCLSNTIADINRECTHQCPRARSVQSARTSARLICLHECECDISLVKWLGLQIKKSAL